ncbi:hypothetical protein FHX37_4206 [Haloactinospora alba]|uniref:Uncharacterized protein n=1 Tax=Haloactinospora alba TaxID=405555 RepID=A0A543N6N7_9ACTN|nr:hypothetical protein FHX37_4206 [Haloactinospora alba]
MVEFLISIASLFLILISTLTGVLTLRAQVKKPKGKHAIGRHRKK